MLIGRWPEDLTRGRRARNIRSFPKDGETPIQFSSKIPPALDRAGFFKLALCVVPSSKPIMNIASLPKNLIAWTLATISIVLVESAKGQSGNYNGLEWEQIGNAVEIYGYNGPGGAVNIPGSVPVGSSNLPVTSIGSNAFYYNTNLTSVNMANSVTNIGLCAFFGCCSLSNITLSSNLTFIQELTFYDCSNLTSLTIPASVVTIGVEPFDNCVGLTDMVIPSNVTSIGDYAFDGCSGLTNIMIPNSVRNIGGYAFSSCSSLTNVTLPSGITSLGDYLFIDCYDLASVTIPIGVTNIGVPLRKNH
jgi:hypothetical protein